MSETKKTPVTIQEIFTANKSLEIKLCDDLKPLIKDGLQSMFNTAKQTAPPNEIFMRFQEFLKDTKNWNANIVEEEVKRLRLHIPQLDNLIIALLVSNIKILNTLRSSQQNVDVQLPTIANFIQKVYINCARQIFANPFLFDFRVNTSQQAANNSQILEIINKQICYTIQQILPLEELFKNITHEDLLKSVHPFEQMANANNEDDLDLISSDEEEDDTEPAPSKSVPTLLPPPNIAAAAPKEQFSPVLKTNTTTQNTDESQPEVEKPPEVQEKDNPDEDGTAKTEFF